MPKTISQALTAAKVKTLKAPGVFADGNGLCLKVKDTGAKSWFQRVTVNGRRANVGIGSFPQVSLADARAAALANSQAIAQGRDILAEKKQAKEEAKKPRIPTFKEAAEIVIEMHEAIWTSVRSADQWHQSLRDFVYPVIGRKGVDEVTTADVLQVLSGVWVEKPTTGKRIRNRLEKIFDWSIASNYRLDNPAGRQVVLALPKVRTEVVHHSALHYSNFPAAYQRISESEFKPVFRQLLQFIFLTGCRSGEARAAEWAEIDWESAVWTIPAHKAKSRREHRIPMSNQALEILRDALESTGGEGLVFQSPRTGRVIQEDTLTTFLRKGDYGFTVHGARSSLRNWLAECTGASWATAEACLAHAVGSTTARSYATTDYLSERTPIMQTWADYLAS